LRLVQKLTTEDRLDLQRPLLHWEPHLQSG